MHPGNMPGFDAYMMLVPDLGMGAYLLTNTSRIRSLPLLPGLVESLVQLLHTSAAVEQGPRRAKPPSLADRVTGHYGDGELGYDVVAINGRIAMVVVGSLERLSWLEPIEEEGRFVASGGFAAGEPVVFGDPRDGRFTELALQGIVLRRAS
jgi:hypothetical protein